MTYLWKMIWSEVGQRDLGFFQLALTAYSALQQLDEVWGHERHCSKLHAWSHGLWHVFSHGRLEPSASMGWVHCSLVNFSTSGRKAGKPENRRKGRAELRASLAEKFYRYASRVQNESDLEVDYKEASKQFVYSWQNQYLMQNCCLCDRNTFNKVCNLN